MQADLTVLGTWEYWEFLLAKHEKKQRMNLGRFNEILQVDGIQSES